MDRAWASKLNGAAVDPPTTSTGYDQSQGGHMPASSSISWTHDLDSALTRTRASQRHILLYFTAAPM